MTTLSHDLDYFDVSIFDPPVSSSRICPKKTNDDVEEVSETEDDDDDSERKFSFEVKLVQSDEEAEDEPKCPTEDEDTKCDSSKGSAREKNCPTVLWSANESVQSRSTDTWDPPVGTIPWDDADRPMEHLLNYADLTLTEQEENGLLTDRIIAACSSYLTESPENKCHVVAKVSLNNKNLNDIRLLGYHRFLQYVDLSWNNLKDLTPLGCIPYLMYLDVSHNLLEEVLRFRPPLNLTYVNYSHNEVWQIDDLSEFWTISYLDLSHNKISKIQGLHELRYLRHLDLSHNKIERFENLNNLRITDLNLEYNLISRFEAEPGLGMNTMPCLTNLYLNNNLIGSLEFLQNVYHLKKLELQGNNIVDLVQLTHMKHLKNLRYLDLLGNGVSTQKPYRSLVLKYLQELQFLDQSDVTISERVAACKNSRFDAQLEAARNNARMVLLEQLNDTTLGTNVLPVDEGPYPFVILVGPSASSKKYIASCVADAHPEKVYLGKLHTTRKILDGEKKLLIQTTQENFNDMIKAGKFLCVSENLGHFYGFSKDELGEAIREGKLCLTTMDMVSALSVHSYGIKPFLVLAITESKEEHEKRLKMTYGPVVSVIGAAYMAQRQLLNTHQSNIKRIQVILEDVLNEALKRKLAEEEVECENPTEEGQLLSADNSGQKSCETNSENLSINVYYDSERQCFQCTPEKCGYQTCRNAVPEYDTTSLTSANESHSSLNETKRDTSTTSYSTEYKNTPLKMEFSLTDEHACGENDIFADWSMPFVEWSELNLTGLQLEEAAELLCSKYVESVMSTRDVYQNLHLNNPGLFSLSINTDVASKAVKCLAKFLREIWHTTPTRKPVFDIKNDLAYQVYVPRKLDRLKEMLNSDDLSSGDGLTQALTTINSPSSICQAMYFKGYGDSFDDVQ